MEIQVTKGNDTLTLLLTGKLDTTTSTQLEESFNKNYSDEISNVILDMKNLEYISSSGLRVILLIQKKLSVQKGKLTIKNICETVKDVFEITGFSDFLNIE